MARLLLLHGDDEYSIDEAFEKAVASARAQPNAAFNTSDFDGSVASVSDVLSAAMSAPFLAEQRLIIVRGLASHLGRKGGGDTAKRATDQLLSALPDLPDSTTLVFLERGKLPDGSRLIRAMPSGSVQLFIPPKDASEWVLRQAKARGADIDRAAARAIASATQNDLRAASNELTKLIAYVAGTRPITEADVVLMTSYVSEASIFEMVDALGQGRSGPALRLMYRLLDQGHDFFSLFAMITRQFRLLLLVKEHFAAGGGRDVSGALGINSFVAEKLATQSRGYTLDQLERIYRRLLDADVQIKTGRIDPNLALDLLAAALAR
jgi:DNA polymerase-3 subunit delta